MRRGKNQKNTRQQISYFHLFLKKTKIERMLAEFHSKEGRKP